MDLLLTSWDGLLDLVSSVSAVDLEGDEVLGRPQLELGDVTLLALLNSDLLGLGQVLLVVLITSHDLNEVLQVFDFLWLLTNNRHG